MNDSHELLITQGADKWNAWATGNKTALSFNRPQWYNSTHKGGNTVDLSEIRLERAHIHDAFAEGVRFGNATVVGCRFEEGDFSRAYFGRTEFIDTVFNKTILTDASFAGATFRNCNLNRVNLAGADFRVEEITETVVYGVAAWDLVTDDEMKQSRLVIEKTYELYSDIIAGGRIPLMVDDIELAQFVYYLSSHKKMRDIINVLNSRGVLLLGRFGGGGLDRLYRLSDWLRERNYMPMIFDFERPDSANTTETVLTMAGLSKFLIADLSGPSVPQELHATMTNFWKPVIVYSEKKPYAMYADLAEKSFFTKEIVYSTESQLFAKLAKALPAAERAYAKLVEQRAKRAANS